MKPTWNRPYKVMFRPKHKRGTSHPWSPFRPDNIYYATSAIDVLDVLVKTEGLPYMNGVRADYDLRVEEA